MEREHQRTDSHRRLFVFSRFWRLRITMLLNQLSMRTSLTVAVMVVGLLGVFFVFTSGDIYRDVSLAQQRTALGEQVKSRISDLRRELDAESQRFVLLSRQESGFVTAVAGGKVAASARHLDQLFEKPGYISGRTTLA